MAFCTYCGSALPDGSRFCPNCGAQTAAAETAVSAATYTPVTAYTTTVPVSSTVSADFSGAGIGEVTGYNVVLVSLGTADASYADDLLSDLLGYSLDQSRTLVSNVPVLIAQSLTKRQALYLMQALTEYGMNVASYNRDGYVDIDDDAEDSIFKKDGTILSKVATVLGTITLANQVSRLIRWNTPLCMDMIFRPRYGWERPVHIQRRFIDAPRVQRPLGGLTDLVSAVLDPGPAPKLPKRKPPKPAPAPARPPKPAPAKPPRSAKPDRPASGGRGYGDSGRPGAKPASSAPRGGGRVTGKGGGNYRGGAAGGPSGSRGSQGGGAGHGGSRGGSGSGGRGPQGGGRGHW